MKKYYLCIIFVLMIFIGNISIASERLSEKVTVEKSDVENLITEIKRRYPDTASIDFEKMPSDDFKIALARSILAERLYDQYKKDFINKFKEKSSKTGRPIVQISGSNITVVDFDSEIEKINKEGVSIFNPFFLSNGSYDSDECWGSGRNGEKYGYRKCYIPDDWEEMSLGILKEGENNKHEEISLLEEDTKSNTSTDTKIVLTGKYIKISDDNHFVDTHLNITENKTDMHSRKSNNNRNDYDLGYHIKSGDNSGTVVQTPFDKDVLNAVYEVKDDGIVIRGEYHSGKN